MAFSDFTLDPADKAFSLAFDEEQDLFAGIPPVRISAHIRATLDEFDPLVTAIHTEKARSEFIVAPILEEVRKLMKHQISLLSGSDFNVDAARGLTGTVHFILARSPLQLLLRYPLVMIVEAKNDSIKSGLGQCVAEMVGARHFNELHGSEPAIIYGCVTTGSLWRFLKLDGPTALIDQIEYSLEPAGKALAIILHCVGGDPAAAGVAA
jgi:hypothetical protein